MKLREIREEKYALRNWENIRPFFCRLSPEYIWNEVRDSIIKEISEELEAEKSNDFKFFPFFVYPPLEQLESLHGDGVFFSEIRELEGYRAAEALSVLAGMIRLESKGPALDLFEECFHNLWQEFSPYGYGHGYDTTSTRSDLVLILGSNNVFELVKNNSWQYSTLEYFETEKDVWSETPLNQIYKSIIKILGGSYEESTEDDLIVKGVLYLNAIPTEKINSFCHSLCWKHLYWGESNLLETDPHPPAMHEQTSFYNLPFHLLRVDCDNFWELEPPILDSPFNRIAMHLFLSLNLRTRIISEMGCDNLFTIEQAATACNIDTYSIQMALGQMIKVGLVEFDKNSGEPWYSTNQQFICKSDMLINQDRTI